MQKQYPSNRSRIAFDELFKARRSPKLTDAENNPFEPIKRRIDEKKYDEALQELVFIFPSNADVTICYELSFQVT